MKDNELANNIYNILKEKGVDIGSASIMIIEKEIENFKPTKDWELTK